MHHLASAGQPKYHNGFTYAEHTEAIDTPLVWKKPRRILVNSMPDMFHEKAAFGFVAIPL